MSGPSYRFPKIPWCWPCGRHALPIATKYGERCTCTGCGAYSWGRAPLVSKATHDARRAAHEAFDPLWKKGPGYAGLTRTVAYLHLAQAMGLHPDDCHMKLMDRETAEAVPAAVERIRTRLEDERLGLLTPYQLDRFLSAP